MNKLIRIRKYQLNDLFPTAALISETFCKYNFKENNPEAASEYAACYNPFLNRKAIIARFDASTWFFVAERDEKIVGMLRAVDNRIVNLFVDEKFHNKGIGNKLIQHYEKNCKKPG